MSFFGFGQNADIDIQLDGMESRKMAEIKSEDGKKEKYYLYYDGETVSGKVNVCLKKHGSRFEHQGIKIEFVGQIELYYDRGNHHEFASLVKELARPGEMTNNMSYDFEFNQVEKPYESYSGTNVRLRYFLRVTVVRRITDVVREMELLVHTLSSYPEMNNSIKMEVGIEDCLHIEFEYNKSKYHIKDVIVGKIYFLLVRIKIKHMEIAIIKKETTGTGPNTFNENDTIAKYEIMDGAPVRGESIPIRVFLAGYDLTPTMRDINKKFSVRYYLNLVLVDEEERRYFKQQEITLWRKGERVRRPIQQQIMAQQLALQQLSLSSLHEGDEAPAPQQKGSFYAAPNSLKCQSQNSEDSDSPILPASAVEPPSPHHSQSPMQEESPPVRFIQPTSSAQPQEFINPSQASFKSRNVEQFENSTKQVKPVVETNKDQRVNEKDNPEPNFTNSVANSLLTIHTVNEIPSRLSNSDSDSNSVFVSPQPLESKIVTPIRHTILADSPPPLPTTPQDQDDDSCAPDLPTPPDEPLAEDLDSPEDEFVEALSSSSPTLESEKETKETPSSSSNQNPVPVAQ